MEIFSLCCTESEKKVHSKMLLNMLDIFSKDQSQTILTNMIKILNVKSSGNFTKAIVSLIGGKAKKTIRPISMKITDTHFSRFIS